MSSLYYSSDIYSNATNLDSGHIFTITDATLSINCSEQVLLNTNVSENINNIKNDLLKELIYW